jgi:hypothetical protein
MTKTIILLGLILCLLYCSNGVLGYKRVLSRRALSRAVLNQVALVEMEAAANNLSAASSVYMQVMRTQLPHLPLPVGVRDNVIRALQKAQLTLSKYQNDPAVGTRSRNPGNALKLTAAVNVATQALRSGR